MIRASFAAVAALVALTISAQAEPLRLQAAIIAPPDNLWSKVGDRYAQAVKERTNGQVIIDMSYSGTLGTAAETIEALKFGTTNIVIQEVGQLDGYDNLAGLASFPYLIRDYDHFKVVMKKDGVGQAFHDEIERRTGFKLIGAGFRGARHMASRRPIETPEDLAGLKLRVPNQQIFRATWEMLGASPTPMPSLEVYSALQQGVIDACENPLEAHLRSKYYEAVPYVIMTGHVNSYYTFIFDSEFFNNLPKETQAILIEEGEKAMEWGSEEIQKLLAKYEEELEKHGAKIIRPDVSAFRKKLEPLKEQYPADFREWIVRFQQAGEG
jgi:tripartite ATP-independent transporter DctP family solute receptor